MSAHTHTPGPWVILYNARGYPHQITAPNEDPTRLGGIVSVTRGASIGLPSSAEGRANARLIAAAPDLLAFIEEYRQAFAYGMAGDSYLLRMAESAIAKATGEHQ